MKLKSHHAVIKFLMTYAILIGSCFSDTYEDISENHRDLLQHKVINREGMTLMNRDAEPFIWLNSKITEIGDIKSLKFVRMELIDNQLPIGNNIVISDNGSKGKILQIPKYKTEIGNGLDYMWFCFVWGFEYENKSDEITKFKKSHGDNIITDKEFADELIRIRCEVVIETRKFFDVVWLPWCKQVGALPTSPVLWLKFAEVNDRKLLVEQLRRSGDIDRIIKWVESLK